MTLSYTIYSDATVFETLKTEWLQLLANSYTNTIFQTPAFLSSWWQVYGKQQLHVMVYRTAEQQVVGILPLQLASNEGEEYFTFVGDVDITDYQDFIIYSEYAEAVLSDFNAYLDQQTVKKVKLFSLPENSPTLTFFQTHSSASIVQQEVCPSIALPATWDQYLESLDRKQRHEVRRKIKKLTENLTHEFVRVEALGLYPEAVTTFIKLHKASSAEKSAFWTPERETFFSLFLEQLSTEQWLKLYFLYIENQPVASMLLFDYNNQFQLYNSGYLPTAFRGYSTGQVLTSYTIKDAIEEKKTVYDFLRGDEVYKFRLGAKAKPVFDIIS